MHLVFAEYTKYQYLLSCPPVEESWKTIILSGVKCGFHEDGNGGCQCEFIESIKAHPLCHPCCCQGALRLASLQHALLNAGLLPNNPGVLVTNTKNMSHKTIVCTDMFFERGWNKYHVWAYGGDLSLAISCESFLRNIPLWTQSQQSKPSCQTCQKPQAKLSHPSRAIPCNPAQIKEDIYRKRTMSSLCVPLVQSPM